MLLNRRKGFEYLVPDQASHQDTSKLPITFLIRAIVLAVKVDTKTPILHRRFLQALSSDDLSLKQNFRMIFSNGQQFEGGVTRLS
jgi:hypothetical protein